MTLYYCFDQRDFEYETAEYTKEDVINFLLRYYLNTTETATQFTRDLLSKMYDEDLIELSYLEEDDDFRDYVAQLNEEDAYACYLEAREYESDPLGYYGLSRSDFFRG